MASPWVSVLMTTYNSAAYLRPGLESIVAQGDAELADVEVIAVDDGSTDSTLEILESYRSRLNLIVRRNEQNVGWTVGTSRATEIARGAYLCWLHHDDVWMPGRVARLKECVSRWPEAVMILHPSWFIDSQGRRFGVWRCPLPPGRLLEPSFVLDRLLVQNFIATPAPLYRSDVVPAVGRLDDRLWYNADWDFWLRVAEIGPCVYHPEPLSGYRIHPNSLTSRRTADSQALQRQFDLILDRYLGGTSAAGQGISWSAVAGPARFSALLNIELARWAAGGRPALGRLTREFLRLGPSGWHRYLRDSRIHERIWNRLQIRRFSGARWRCETEDPVSKSGGVPTEEFTPV